MNSAALSPIFDHVRMSPLIVTVLVQLLHCFRQLEGTVSPVQPELDNDCGMGPGDFTAVIGCAGLVGGFPKAGLPPTLAVVPHMV